MSQNRRILIIDDNAAIHEDFRKLLTRGEDEGLDDLEAAIFGAPDQPAAPQDAAYDVDSAHQGQEGYELVRRAVEAGRRYALAFVDMRMPPGWDGMETIGRIFEVDDEIQVVICTAYSEYSWEDIVQRFPQSDRLLILKKPFDTAEVCQLAAALTEKWHLAKRAHLKREQLEAMVQEQTSELRRINHTLMEEVERRAQVERALRQSEDRYALAAAGARDGVWDWDLAQGALHCSPRWWAMFGLEEPAEPVGPERWLERVLPEDRPALAERLQEHIASAEAHIQCEYRVQHADGQPRWMLCRGMAIRDGSGRAQRIAGSQTDITDRKMAEEQLRRVALHDALTGLPNRLLLRERLERCIARAARSPASRYAILYMDLDRFKVINDSLGHAAGDELLRTFAERVVSATRATDTFARQGPSPLARLGGDEFILLLEEFRDDNDVFRVAERVLAAVAAPLTLEGREITPGCSIGVALGHPRYTTPEELLRDADLALHHAKEQGKGRFVLFDGQIHSATLARWQLETELREALGTGAFFLHYQPIVSLRTGAIRGVEALVRWRHPRKGMVSPAEFIPLAEETGLIVPLGLEVLRTACRDLRAWQAEHPELAGLQVSVNVSPRQVERPGFAASVLQILDESGVDPRSIDLEITESVLLDNSRHSRAELDVLRARGIQLHLDDFGTGYCSLSYLRQVRVDALKIDQSFTRSMGDDPMTEPIVRAILSLAESFGIDVVAEGVETEAQRQKLATLGCAHAQGYLFCRPVDRAALPAALLGAERLAKAS